MEKLLLVAEDFPWSVLFRTLVGAAFFPCFFGLFGENRGPLSVLVGFLGVLIILRVGFGVARMALPVSIGTKEVWAERRAWGKRFDSYQWQKLFGFGLGIGLYLWITGRTFENPSGAWLSLACLLGGGVGLLSWRNRCASGASGDSRAAFGQLAKPLNRATGSEQRSIPRSLNLHAGEVVLVRRKEEILSTLDRNGRLEEMPFMPEMFQYCGQSFRVAKRAHKTCDPVNGLESRRLKDSVHLEGLRCDGSSHGGCEAGCLLFWKEGWLTRVGKGLTAPRSDEKEYLTSKGCTEEDVRAGTVANRLDEGNPGNLTYVCQSTQVAAATVPLKWWDIRQYVEDFRSGNVSIAQLISAFAFSGYHHICGMGLGIGSAMRLAYDAFQRCVGGPPYPWRVGRVPKGTRTPTMKLDVKEGDVVRVRSYSEILDTLDEGWKNRGLYFDAEMVPYTKGTFTVLKRVQHIIDEKSGKMLNLKNEALILDGVVCQARYAKCRKLCPRAYYLYWREIWVERVSASSSGRVQHKQG